jgi:hypothetical protein
MRTALADGSVVGERFVTWHRPVTTHAGGRVCAEPECGTRLSIYNSADRCSLHRSFVTIVPRNAHHGGANDT